MDWVKNHPLEGDNLRINFYNYIWKKNKDFESCKNILVPDTVIYDHNFPRGWYCYDKKGVGEFKKKQGNELDASSILSVFRKPSGCDILASYMSRSEDATETIVQFFDYDSLTYFLTNQQTKNDGILQRFISPKGFNNSVIQVVWSPRVCLLQRKTNIHSLYDTSIPAYTRAVTYEGPSHFGEDSVCALSVTERIKGICNNIAIHFNCAEHSKVLTRFVLYFKVDSEDSIWFLWCDSVRVGSRSGVPRPLELSPKYTLKYERSSVSGRMARLAADEKQHSLSRESLSHGRMTRIGKLRGNPVRKSENCDRPPDNNTAQGAPAVACHLERIRDRIVLLRDCWMRVTPEISKQYLVIQDNKKKLIRSLDEVSYVIYSHFQVHCAPEFVFELPSVFKEVLMDEFKKFQKVFKFPMEETVDGNCYRIPPELSTVVSKVNIDSHSWIQSYFLTLERSLKLLSHPLVERAAIHIVRGMNFSNDEEQSKNGNTIHDDDSYSVSE